MFKIHCTGNDLTIKTQAEEFLAQWYNTDEFVTAHTSGSTGAPKKIHLPKSDMRVSARATNRRFGLNHDSRMLCPLSLGYIAGKIMMVRALDADCQLLMTQPSNRFLENPEVMAYTRKAPVDLTPVVPSQCLHILEMAAHPEGFSLLSNLRDIIIGGAPLAPETEKRLMALSDDIPALRFHMSYGMTETCSHVALRPLGTQCFEAMPGITFGTESRSCLTISAPEYSFVTLTTNDIAELLSSHSFIWKGRFDNVINSGGIKIFPEEIERTLASALSAPFYIKGIPDEKWGATLCLVIEEPAPSDAELAEICKTLLPPVKRPRSIRRMESLARTSTGKIKRI